MIELIDGWRHIWWRRVSTWLAVLNGVLAGYVFSNPVLVVGLLGFAPGEWLWPLAIGAASLAFGLPVLVAHVKQPKLQATVAEIMQKEEKDAADGVQ